jgi:hypothetical protein
MGRYGQHDDAALMGDGDCAAENERDAEFSIPKSIKVYHSFLIFSI